MDDQIRSYPIFDGSFSHQRSATLGCYNDRCYPEKFSWEREITSISNVVFYTDMHIRNVIAEDPRTKVAWLLEPPSLHDGHYTAAIEMEDKYDHILTFRRDLLSRGDKWKFYPLGGSWINNSEWGVHKKSKGVCIIVSQKVGATGHRLRHEVVSELARAYHIDVYGRGYKPFSFKEEFLADYRYAIVIESWSGKDYFSEKLVDALSVGCVPIYCGCPSIGDYFDSQSIIPFTQMHQLEKILTQVVSVWDYKNRTNSLHANLFNCLTYRCAEDWIFETYKKEIFNV